MSLTVEQLDQLCGGAPSIRRRCPRGCGHVVGPYYSAPLARAAIADHVRWAHVTPAEGER